MAIYARQISPECQESPLMIFDEWPENVIFDGNRHYNSRTTPEYDNIKRYLPNAAHDWENANYYFIWAGSGYKKIKIHHPNCTLSEILSDYGFYRPDGKPWTTRQRHEWKLIFERDICDDEEAIQKAMELLTGKKWEFRQICGCCQGDWQDILYPVDEYDNDDISRLETEYFNTGTEWIIDDGEFDPDNDSPLNIDGSSIYCTAWDENGIKKEIATCECVSPDEVKLYFFDGYHKTAKYRGAV